MPHRPRVPHSLPITSNPPGIRTKSWGSSLTPPSPSQHHVVYGSTPKRATACGQAGGALPGARMAEDATGAPAHPLLSRHPGLFWVFEPARLFPTSGPLQRLFPVSGMHFLAFLFIPQTWTERGLHFCTALTHFITNIFVWFSGTTCPTRP